LLFQKLRQLGACVRQSVLGTQVYI